MSIARSHYRFTEIPKKIDLTKPIMPKRSDIEQGYLYGVDQAWLCEVMRTYLYLEGWRFNPEKAKVPEYPTIASWHNWLRGEADTLKENSNQLYGETIPTQPFTDLSDTQIDPIQFGDVPANVKVGDPLQKSDVMDMFNFLRGVKHVIQYGAMEEYNTTYNTTHFQEGDGDWHRLAAPSKDQIYNWRWRYFYDSYRYESGGAYTDGAWREDVGTMNFKITFDNLPPDSCQLVRIFVLFGGKSDVTGDAVSKFIPVNVISQQTEGYKLTVHAQITAQEVQSVLQVYKKPYKEDLEEWHDETEYELWGSGYTTLYHSWRIYGFFKLNNDYCL